MKTAASAVKIKMADDPDDEPLQVRYLDPGSLNREMAFDLKCYVSSCALALTSRVHVLMRFESDFFQRD